MRSNSTGLSPPTRGIPSPILPNPAQLRSIPAYAGDPMMPCAITADIAVYPRLRGGSCHMYAIGAGQCGLSPPTRGIPTLVV